MRPARLALAAALLASPATAFDPTGIPEADAVLAGFETDLEHVVGIGEVRRDGDAIVISDIVTEITGNFPGSTVIKTLRITAPLLVDGGVHAERMLMEEARLAQAGSVLSVARTVADDMRIRPGALSYSASYLEMHAAFGRAVSDDIVVSFDGGAITFARGVFEPSDRDSDGVLAARARFSGVSMTMDDALGEDTLPDLGLSPADLSIDYRWDESGALTLNSARLSISEYFDVTVAAEAINLTPESDFELLNPAADATPPAFDTVRVSGATLSLTNLGIGQRIPEAMADAMGVPADVARMIQQQAIEGALLAVPDAQLRAGLSLASAAMLADEETRVTLTLDPPTPVTLRTIEQAFGGDMDALPSLGLTINVEP